MKIYKSNDFIFDIDIDATYDYLLKIKVESNGFTGQGSLCLNQTLYDDFIEHIEKIMIHSKGDCCVIDSDSTRNYLMFKGDGVNNLIAIKGCFENLTGDSMNFRNYVEKSFACNLLQMLKQFNKNKNM